MTRREYLEKLEAEGFTFSKAWSARSGLDTPSDLHHYFVYGPAGHLLTSVIIQEMTDRGKVSGACAYFCMESPDMSGDLAALKTCNEKALARAA